MRFDWCPGGWHICVDLDFRTCCQFPAAEFLPDKKAEFLPDKKARPDLNLQAIGLKFAQIVAFCKTYNLRNFQLDTFKIKRVRSKMRMHIKKCMSLRGVSFPSTCPLLTESTKNERIKYKALICIYWKKGSYEHV